MRASLLTDVLSAIKNGERAGKLECTVPASRLVGEVLRVMKARGYIRDYRRRDDGPQGAFAVALQGRINDCGAVNPRHSVGRTEFERWEKRFLPARNFGVLILSTPRGVMTHREAQEAGTGGVLLAYVY